MTLSALGRRLSLWVAVAALSGCAGNQPLTVPLGLTPQQPASNGPSNDHSWIASEAQSEDLLYVADAVRPKSGRARVLIFTYPDGKVVGELDGFRDPIYGLCVNREGDVFVADFYGEDVREYAHGGDEPILTLHANGQPFGCAVDPISGDLAVPLFCDGSPSNCSSKGTVLIYPKARGRPKRLKAPNLLQPYFSTYDGAGDLFINGLAGEFYTATYDELPHGGSRFQSLSLNNLPRAEQPGGIQWIAGDLAVAPISAGNVIYQYHLSGSSGTRVGVTKLGGVPRRNGVHGFWVQGKTLVAPEWNIQAQRGIGQVQLFSYPAGGKATATIDHVFAFPTAAVVSLASQH